MGSVMSTRGGPFESDMVDFLETATGTSVLLMSFSKPHCRSNLAVSRESRSPSHNNEPTSSSQPLLRRIVEVQGVCWLLSANRGSTAVNGVVIRAEELRKRCQPSSRRLFCGLSATQPGPGNAFRGPHFSISVPYASRGMLDEHDRGAVRE
jgi:hypothetical protein